MIAAWQRAALQAAIRCAADDGAVDVAKAAQTVLDSLPEIAEARVRVLAIVDDLSDRRGLGQQWWQIDEGVRDEILETWTRIVGGGT
jgi:hypothetical protein